MKRRFSVLLSIPALLLAAPALAEWVGPMNEYATGEVSAGRNDTVVCSGINKSSDPVDMVAILKDMKGDELEAVPCDGLASGAICSASIKHPSPIPLLVYCWVSTDIDAPATGNLRLDDPNGVSKATSDLQPVSQGVYTNCCDCI